MARAQRERLATSDFDAVMAEPSVRLRAGALRMIAKPNGLDRFRLGFVVGKRQLPFAVDRNRLKRQLRAAFHAALPATPAPALDVVIRLTGGRRDRGRQHIDAEHRAWAHRLLHKFRVAIESPNAQPPGEAR